MVGDDRDVPSGYRHSLGSPCGNSCRERRPGVVRITRSRSDGCTWGASPGARPDGNGGWGVEGLAAGAPSSLLPPRLPGRSLALARVRRLTLRGEGSHWQRGLSKCGLFSGGGASGWTGPPPSFFLNLTPEAAAFRSPAACSEGGGAATPPVVVVFLPPRERGNLCGKKAAGGFVSLV